MAHPDTIAVHGGEPPLDRPGVPVVPDIAVSSAGLYPDLETLDQAMVEHRGYGRWGTENHRQLESAVAALEGADLKGSFDAQVTASGMAAIAVALLTELNSGDHIVAAHDCYGTTLTFLRDDLPRYGITSTVVDFQDLDAVRSAVTERTRVLLCEVCTNPLIRVPDIEALSKIAHDAGAILMVDNTVPTPVLSQPFRWGADVVLYSATKNLSGHADVIGGAIVARPAWIEAARSFTHTFGPTLGPFDAWLTLRGLRTLAVNGAAHEQRARACPVPGGPGRGGERPLPGTREQPLPRPIKATASGGRGCVAVVRSWRRQSRPGGDGEPAANGQADAQPGPRRHHAQPSGFDVTSRAHPGGADARRDQ